MITTHVALKACLPPVFAVAVTAAIVFTSGCSNMNTTNVVAQPRTWAQGLLPPIALSLKNNKVGQKPWFVAVLTWGLAKNVDAVLLSYLPLLRFARDKARGSKLLL